MQTICLRFVTACVGFGFLMAAGCGGGGSADAPDLGVVTGTITLDGKPLPGATVGFLSTSEQRVSTGKTDSEGHYTMFLRNDIKGAPLGQNSVTVSTVVLGDDSVPGSGKPETLPAKYNSKTTLSADVEPGENTINFALDSK